MYKSTLYDQICSLKIAPWLIHERKNGSTKSQGLYKMVPPQLMVENLGKWREGPQQITRLVQDGPPQLMVENPNPGKWQEGPHLFLRTTNKTAPLGATKYWKRKYQSLLLLLFLVLDSFYFVFFCFVSSIMGVNLSTSFQKYRCFWLEKHGSTYTRENTVFLSQGGTFLGSKIRGPSIF